eukprot:CAMPEP_0118682894 /NCGR_PEP_ID=MMETSP0800-20121206/5737_1 /TAXON_ID=210618 ORGANISM="Striatella unipunctata, Strain CCMP2910" /NCGR_SAMPLE_ID=MMETSP0800 /ASSEMBLY_ACC=CAM_ASM_000638 /LENGTH=468 /DNA_ID=CAMNT_0006579331 /DNA_START=55 /DNA_END=1461 /DNA_ORIENTATION=+
MDVAGAVAGNILSFEEPPKELLVTEPVAATLLAIVGCALLFQATLLYSAIRHRNHLIMKMSQGPFLVLIVVCGMVATVSCIFNLPYNDWFCKLRSPMSCIPVQMIGAVLVGRLWRVNSILSGTLRISSSGGAGGGDDRKKMRKYEDKIVSVLEMLADWRWLFMPWTKCRRCRRRPPHADNKRRDNRRSLRHTVTAGPLIRLILVLTLPQIVIQIAKAWVQPQSVILEYNEDRTVVREQCGPESLSMQLCSWGSSTFVYLLAVVMAWLSTDLPSIFNERDAIFNVAWINLFVVMSGLSLTLISDNPTISPNVTAFLFSSTTILVVVATSYMVLSPKLQRIHSGEKIVLSKLLQERRYSNGPMESIVMPPDAKPLWHRTTDVSSGTDVEIAPEQSPPQEEEIPTVVNLKATEPPPRRLERQLLSIRTAVSNVTTRTLEGRPMEQTDWDILKAETKVLNDMMAQIQYDWEE